MSHFTLNIIAYLAYIWCWQIGVLSSTRNLQTQTKGENNNYHSAITKIDNHLAKYIDIYELDKVIHVSGSVFIVAYNNHIV